MQTRLARLLPAEELEEPEQPVEVAAPISVPMSATLPPRVRTMFARGSVHRVPYPSPVAMALAARGAAFSMEELEESVMSDSQSTSSTMLEVPEPPEAAHGYSWSAAPTSTPTPPPLPTDTSSNMDNGSGPSTPPEFRHHPGTPVVFSGPTLDSRLLNIALETTS